MTEKEFLDDLKKELIKNNITDETEIEDILSLYEEHFYYKIEEGYIEDEISKNLSSPQEIAKEFIKPTKPINKYEKFTKKMGIIALSIPVLFIYAFMLASVIVISAFAIVSFVTGTCLILNLNIANLIPNMPYFPALILGIACFGLSILSAIGTIYMFLYIKQWTKVYFRWCRNIINNNKYPSISMHPKMSKKFASKLRLISIIGLIVFIASFALGYFIMCLKTKSFEPWHVWNWFV